MVIVRTKSQHIALMVTLSLAVPLLALCVVGFLDGLQQWREAPLRALLGEQTFTALTRGERTASHYYGHSLRAPSFTLKDRSGAAWSIAEHRGKTIILNFWSVYCEPCLAEMPSLIELANLVSTWGDTEVVTVSVDKNWAEASAAFQAPPPFPVLFDPTRQVVSQQFGSRLFPETWIIDSEGIIRLRLDGAQDWSSSLILAVIQQIR